MSQATFLFMTLVSEQICAPSLEATLSFILFYLFSESPFNLYLLSLQMVNTYQVISDVFNV